MARFLRTDGVPLEQCSTDGRASSKTAKAWALTNKFKCVNRPGISPTFPAGTQWQGLDVHKCGVEAIGTERTRRGIPYVTNPGGDYYFNCSPPGEGGNYIVGSPDGDALYDLLHIAYTSRKDFRDRCVTAGEKSKEDTYGTKAWGHKQRWEAAKTARDTCKTSEAHVKAYNKYTNDAAKKSATDAENERKRLAREARTADAVKKWKAAMAKVKLQQEKEELMSSHNDAHAMSGELDFGFGPKQVITSAQWDKLIAAKQNEIEDEYNDGEESKAQSRLEGELAQLKEDKKRYEEHLEDVKKTWSDEHKTVPGYEELSTTNAHKALGQQSRGKRPSEKGPPLEELLKTIDNDIMRFTQNVDSQKKFWAGWKKGQETLPPRELLTKMLSVDHPEDTFKLKFCVPRDGDVPFALREMGIPKQHIEEYLKKAETKLRGDGQMCVNIEIPPYDFMALVLTDVGGETSDIFSESGRELRVSLGDFMRQCERRAAELGLSPLHFQTALFNPLITKLRNFGASRRALERLYSEGKLGEGTFDNTLNNSDASSNDNGPTLPLQQLAHIASSREFQNTVVQCLGSHENYENNPVLAQILHIVAQGIEGKVDEKYFRDIVLLYKFLNKQLKEQIDWDKVAGELKKPKNVDAGFVPTMDKLGVKVGVRGGGGLNLTKKDLIKVAPILGIGNPKKFTLADLINFNPPADDQSSFIVKEIIRVLYNKFNKGGILLMKFAESPKMSGDTSTLLNTITPELLHAILLLLFVHSDNLSTFIADVENCLSSQKKRGGRRKRKKTRRKNKKRKKTRRKGKKRKKTRRNTNKKRKKTRRRRKEKNRKSKKNNRHRKTKRN